MQRGAAALLGLLLLAPHLLALGQPYFMDETAVLDNVLTFVGARTLVPYHTKYPTLFSYLAAPAVLAGAGLRWLGASGESAAELVARLYWDRPRALILPARALSLVALVAAALAVRAIDRRRDAVAGAVAACGLVASPALVAYASYGLPDVTALALTAAALGLAMRALDERDGVATRRLTAASVAAGLAVSAKYTAAPAFAPVGVVWLLRRRSRSRRGVVREAVTLALAGAAGCLAGSPGWLLAPGRFVAGLRFEIEHAAEGHLGAAGVPLLGQVELLAGGAPWLALGGLAGLALAAAGRDGRGERDRALAPAALVAAGLAVCALSSKQSLHYMAPVYPALAWGTGRLAAAARQRAGRVGLAAVALCLALAAGVSLVRGLAHVGPPTDELAGRWIEANVPTDRRIAVDMGYVPVPYDRERLAFLRGTTVGAAAPGAVDRIERSRPVYDEVEPIRHDPDWLRTTDAEFLVTSDGCSERFFEHGRFTARRPAPGSPLLAEFETRRAFYETLFASPRWRVAHRVPAGNGPSVTVYRRDERSR